MPTDIINNSHQIQVQYPTNNPADFITLGGVPFDLAQFHYHDPSETTVAGKRDNMEEHFVTTSATGAETVVAVLLRLGTHNNAIQPILDAATANLTKPNTTTKVTAPIDFSGLLPSNLTGWFYVGSLSTPPDSDPVNWLVLSTPITLDANQLAQYEAVAASGGFLPNARPSQPLDGRIVNQLGNQVVFAGPGIAGDELRRDDEPVQPLTPPRPSASPASAGPHPGPAGAVRFPQATETAESGTFRHIPRLRVLGLPRLGRRPSSTPGNRRHPDDRRTADSRPLSAWPCS